MGRVWCAIWMGLALWALGGCGSGGQGQTTDVGVSACRSDDDCGDGLRCELSTGRCVSLPQDAPDASVDDVPDASMDAEDDLSDAPQDVDSAADARGDDVLPDDGPSCEDGQRNGAESDMDCGGPDCVGCAQGAICGDHNDCLSLTCANGVCEAARCGDGVRGAGEACDDGNTLTETCTYGVIACTVCAEDCTELPGVVRVCGDGNVDIEEACDDGNTDTEACAYNQTQCTVCAADCTEQSGAVRFCGDGQVDPEEACDDGNTDTEGCAYGQTQCTVCAADCTEQPGVVRVCGDGNVDIEEACDDGNTDTELCSYGRTECTVCAGDCTEQPGVVRFCGDGEVDAEEDCDDGNALTDDCLANEGPCTVCQADCRWGPGIQIPAPLVWDGEAGDGLWATASNWSADRVPTEQDWVVVGQGARVVGLDACHHLTIEEGAVVADDDQWIQGCDVRVDGTLDLAEPGTMRTPGVEMTLRGRLGPSVNWLDTRGARFVFVNGASFANPGLNWQWRFENAATFVLGTEGFSTLTAQRLWGPASWDDVAIVVDISAYELTHGHQITLLDFGSLDDNFDTNALSDVQIIAGESGLEAEVDWNPGQASLNLIVATAAPPEDVQVSLSPDTVTAVDTLTAHPQTQHPTARFTYAWSVNGEPLGIDTTTLSGPGHFSQGDEVLVSVLAHTSGGQSGPFEAAITVSNSPPILSELRVSPSNPTVTDTLTVHVEVQDPDPGDPALVNGCVWQRWEGQWVDLPDAQGATLQPCQSRPGCVSGERVRASCTATDGVAISNPAQTPTVTILPEGCTPERPECQPLALGGPPTTDWRDYSFWYWPGNHRPVETWPNYQRQMHFMTGHYGLTFDESTGQMARFGTWSDALDVEQASLRSNDDFLALPQAAIAFEAGSPDASVLATGFRGADGGEGDIARMTDGGRFMNRIEIPTVTYQGDENLEGFVEIAAMPRHVVWTHTVRADAPNETARTARIRLGGDAVAGLNEVQWLIPERALRLTDGQGQGFVFVVYDEPGTTTTLLRSDDGAVVAQRQSQAPSAQSQTVSVLALPVSAVSEQELAVFLNPQEAVDVRYTLLNHEGEAVRDPVAVPWDPVLGAFRVDLGTLSQAGLGHPRDYDLRPELHNWYGRHRLFVDTHQRGPIAVPMAFFGGNDNSLYITGGVALLRDANGEPLGVPVQISKNWHDPPAWYHFYTQPIFDGAEPQEMELTVASSRWGAQAYAASHAQLSLIGYGSAGGHWDQSALGAFGESITYDPDVTLGRAMMDDVRPFLVDNGRRWNWTGNVGGADFLRYRTAAEPFWVRRLSQVTSTYHDYGPNLTDVVYAGISTDGRIQAKVRTQLGRTDDLVRTHFHFEYTFLDDVEYDRLAFFQMAADRYGDNGFARCAYGNAQGVLDDRAIEDHRTTGYASDADRGIALLGEAPWVMLYDNQKIDDRLPEHHADLAFVVRHFEAQIGQTTLRTPHINLHQTFNADSQIGIELGLPHEEGSPWCGEPCQGRTRFIPAGSTVRATIEYLVPPSTKDLYYGQSDHLTAMDAADYRSTRMAMALAVGNTTEVEVFAGELRRQAPIEIAAQPGVLATEFALEGGLGYLPVTVSGLARHDGWRLERQDNGQWTPVDQSVMGNDYWQANHDALHGTYSLTWNVPNQGLQRYRVVWSPVPR